MFLTGWLVAGIEPAAVLRLAEMDSVGRGSQAHWKRGVSQNGSSSDERRF